MWFYGRIVFLVDESLVVWWNTILLV